jgi:WD40 repeat protein
VKLWNATTGELSHTFKHPGYVSNLVFSPDGTRIAAGGRNKPFHGTGAPSIESPGACVVKVWSVATGKEIASLEGTGWAANMTRFSLDGKFIASVCIGKARIWDASRGRVFGRAQNSRCHFRAVIGSRRPANRYGVCPRLSTRWMKQ